MPRVATGKPAGRPPKKNPQVVARILKFARTGLPLKFAAQAGNIDAETLAQWRAKDPEFAKALSQARLAAVEEKWKLIQKAAEDRVDADGKLLKAGDWRSLAWSLERAYPAEFARPEVALNLAIQNNVTQNHLTINITGTEAAQIEEQADPVRRRVSEMIARYRPQSLGNGEGKTHDVEAEPVIEQAVPQDVPQAIQQALIRHNAGDEKRREFWRSLVSSDPQKKITKAAAIFAIRTLLAQLIGHKGHRLQIDFADDPTTTSDLFALLEKLCGGSAGWQLAQKLAGY